ncbi:MAG: type II toxin-antitoxin system HicB family antitoxin [Desulfobacteraceae bacterium]|jgi:predicted RNase H-like HicB family nuclease
MSKFDGYSVNLFLDDDGEWLAHFVEMPNISAFGESPETALKELETAWNATKKIYVKNGESVPLAPSKGNIVAHSISV